MKPPSTGKCLASLKCARQTNWYDKCEELEDILFELHFRAVCECRSHELQVERISCIKCFHFSIPVLEQSQISDPNLELESVAPCCQVTSLLHSQPVIPLSVMFRWYSAHVCWPLYVLPECTIGVPVSHQALLWCLLLNLGCCGFLNLGPLVVDNAGSLAARHNLSQCGRPDIIARMW